jgi:HSP20 family protein
MANNLENSVLLIRVSNLDIRTRPHAWHPPTDLFETDDGYTIRLEVAGMNEQDFSIQYNQSMLVIMGKRPMLNPKCAYHRMEISSGEFFTTVQMPDNIDIEHASAEYDRGFLTIEIPRKLPVNIEINNDGGND